MDEPPLLGAVVGITADRRRKEQALLLERHGARPLHGPTIRTLPLAPDDGIEAATKALIDDPPEVVILNTGIGTRSWFSAAEALRLDEDLRAALSHADVLARGPKAAGAAVANGLPLTMRAKSEQSTELVDHVVTGYRAGVRVAVQLDGSAQSELPDVLRRAGADVVEVRIYRWTQPDDPGPAQHLVEAICDRRVDAVTFTSSPALENLVSMAADQGVVDAVRSAFKAHVAAVCVGPVCAGTAQTSGIRPAVVPVQARLGAMVQALVSHLADPPRLRIAGTEVRLRRSSVVIEGRVVDLSLRERAVLEVLADRPGTVVSKDTLRRVVWPSKQADDHTIGVTVARLRRRLGAAGTAVQTSHRRGYRLVAERLTA